MSLVNGMLRDLDRRRDAPTRTGIGSERLVPVADAQRAAPLAAQHYPDSGDLAAADYRRLLFLAAQSCACRPAWHHPRW